MKTMRCLSMFSSSHFSLHPMSIIGHLVGQFAGEWSLWVFAWSLAQTNDRLAQLDHDALGLCPAFPNSSTSSCNLFFSRLQGRSTALSLWFKIAVNLTKWQFINPAKLGRLYLQPEGTLFRRIKFHYNEGKIICTPPPSPCHLSLSPNRFSHLDYFLTRPPINRVSHS